MSGLFDWVIHLPQYFGEFGLWLVNPLPVPFDWCTPIAALGTGAVAFFGVVIVLKIKNLIL